MRGFDYRCPAGLALLIAKKLDSKRALKQAFSRVGRYNEDVCARFVIPELGSLEPIDTEKQDELVKKITAGIQNYMKSGNKKMGALANQPTLNTFIKKTRKI